MALPFIMVAPNGAYKSKQDHPSLPIIISEIVDTARLCRTAGADGMHAHVRDGNGKHVLDVGLYRELLAECAHQLPGFYIQITTEAIGVYSPREQVSLVKRLIPKAVSVALGELCQRDNEPMAREFYTWANEAGVEVQHILYSAEDVTRLAELIGDGTVATPPSEALQLLFVLGRYRENRQSAPDDLVPFMQALKLLEAQLCPVDWAACAFGNSETDCLVKTSQLGGKVRVGFENNLYHADGSLAASNAERVTQIVERIK